MARVSRKNQAATAKGSDNIVQVWKTAIYVRLSVEDNGKVNDSDSIENQQALLEQYVSSKPYLHKEAVFIDNGYTGTNFLRPEFTKLIEAVQDGRINCIVVKDLSRLGRNYIETSRFIEKICPFYGLRFIAVNDDYDTATITSEHQLSASLSNIVNDYYAKDISRKVTSALETKMERGDYIGNYAPHGYIKDPNNKNHLLICPETAPIIRQIFEWRAEGVSYSGINRRLNEAGIPSPSQYKKDHGVKTNNNQKDKTILWNKHMVTEILNNIVYMGHLAQRKGIQCLYGGIPYHVTDRSEWIVVYNTHEPIISSELFEKVQSVNRETVERQKANSGKYDYLPKAKNIYGKKFICAECGAVMKLHRSFSTKKDKVYFTYKCPTYAEHGKKGCLDVKIRMSDLNTAVFSFIKSQMNTFIDVENDVKRLLALKRANSKKSSSKTELRALQRKLASKKSLLSSLYVDFREGLVSGEDFTSHKAIISEDIQAITTAMEELEATADKTTEELMSETKWLELMQKYCDAKEMSEELADAFVESIKISADNSLSIKLRYADELERLTSARETLRREVA